MSQDNNAVTDPTDTEWAAIVDFNGAWEHLQAAVERYGQRVAREAYALGRLRENTAIDRALAAGFSTPSAAVIPVKVRKRQRYLARRAARRAAARARAEVTA